MPNPNRFNTFRDLVATNALAPAVSNLWEFRIPPPLFMSFGGGLSAKTKEFVSNVNYYATSVTVPSRAVTTGEINNFGMIRRFATGQTNSSVNVSFLVTKDQSHRAFFERWLNYAASDADNTVGFYDDYVSDMSIIKWENGTNFKIAGQPPEDAENKDMFDFNPQQSTAVYQLYGAFPINISTMTLDNEQTNLLQMDIEFYFERYRFDQVGTKQLKYKEIQPVYTWEEIQLRVEGSGNPDVERFSV